VGVVGLELRVEVDLLVHRVDEPVQALAGVDVGAVGDDAQLVVRGETGDGDPVAVEGLARHRLAVEDDLAYGWRGQLEERRGARFAAREADDRGGDEGLVAGRQVQRHRVGVDREKGGSALRLVAQEVVVGHGVESSVSKVRGPAGSAVAPILP
jgi:hypothetical protein